MSRPGSRTLVVFGSAVLAFCLLVWGAEWAWPATAASAAVFLGLTALAAALVRPGWNLRPQPLFRPYWLALLAMLLASAAFGAWFLRHFAIPVPYGEVDLVAKIPLVLALAGAEELLFRQVMYRWLERRIPARGAVLATALAFGAAHLGPVLTGSARAGFSLLQSAYLVWIGLVLGEARRTSGSWLVPWLGHFAYNVAVLYLLARFPS